MLIAFCLWYLRTIVAYVLIAGVLSFIGSPLTNFFDIIKPYPINLIDTKMKDGIGVMLDDLVAGIFSAIIIYLIAYLCF